MNYHEAEGIIPFVNARTKISTASVASVAANPTNLEAIADAPVDLDGLFKDFQQKIDIYSPALEAETAINSTSSSLATEIVVIASLLEKLPNLAGLARSCEIFGVKRLMVSPSADLSSPDFVNVAMTAEKWLDLKPLAIEAIPNYLASLKQEGKRVTHESLHI